MEKNLNPWITVIGIGEDGLDGLGAATRALINSAEVLVGGERHLGLAASPAPVQFDWQDGFGAAMDRIESEKGKRIVVLASGDPLYFGVGSALARRFGADALFVVPAVGAVSLACARMGWSIPDIEVVTVHGRPLENLNYHLQPGARIIALTSGGESPGEVAALLTEKGFGPSKISVLEHLGGEKENRFEGIAQSWNHPMAAELNMLAIECIVGPNAQSLSRLAGLPDDAFEHDGQITKREVRAITLASLAPKHGEVLWDIGAGAGSISIEWMRTKRGLRAIAIEQNADRCAVIARNALKFGTTRIEVIQGSAPDALQGISPAPDAVFIGGGVSIEGVIEAAWDALKPGGRLVANAVTVEGEKKLMDFAKVSSGELIRISIERQQNLGGQSAFRPMMPVTQLVATKPGALK